MSILYRDEYRLLIAAVSLLQILLHLYACPFDSLYRRLKGVLVVDNFRSEMIDAVRDLLCSNQSSHNIYSQRCLQYLEAESVLNAVVCTLADGVLAYRYALPPDFCLQLTNSSRTEGYGRSTEGRNSLVGCLSP